MLVFIDGENFRQLLVATLEKEKVISKTTPFKINLVGLFKELLKTNNTKINYICFSNFRNMAVSAATNKTIVIPTKLLKKYISTY